MFQRRSHAATAHIGTSIISALRGGTNSRSSSSLSAPSTVKSPAVMSLRHTIETSGDDRSVPCRNRSTSGSAAGGGEVCTHRSR